AWSRGQAGRESEERLWQAGVPAAFCVHPNHSGGTAQHGFRGFLQWYEHPVTGSTPYFSYPFLVDGAHLTLGGPAPTLGQHTDQVLESLGLDEAAIARLWEQGVTDDWPVGVPRP
ncbi:MAG: CoA transferase, partial [Actinomycetota bacterium]|nr:CoA transferase [Actinomycetota bacterium]